MKFSVCTFNLFNYLAPPDAFYDAENIYTSRQWAQKQDWIIRRLAELSADIVGFQEVFSPDSLKALVATQGYDHFVTVSDPRIREHHIYYKPVVALASRFPVLSAEAVDVNAAVIADLGLQASFAFSRPPIRAEVQIDGFATVLVYIMHLKSKRSLLESSLVESPDDVYHDVSDSVLAQIHGRWASAIQRGTEAALIYQDIIEQTRHQHRPVIVMGDMNDTLDSPAVQPLLGSLNMGMLDGRYVSGMTVAQQRAINGCLLSDAFELSADTNHGSDSTNEAPRKSTHYFANRGSVLDHIFLSQDFNGHYDQSLASVLDYTVLDRHITQPHSELDAQSTDHGLVKVEIETRY